MMDSYHVARSTASVVTSNVLVVPQHSLVVATDYEPSELEDKSDLWELIGGEDAADYRSSLRVCDDAEEVDGVCILEFHGLVQGGTYSLHVTYESDPESTEAVRSPIFEDVAFEELATVSPNMDDEIAREDDETNHG